MDFTSLGGMISGLSTSGAQWFALVNSPAGSVPAPAIPSFTSTSPLSVAGNAVQSGTNLLLIGALLIGGIFVIKALRR